MKVLDSDTSIKVINMNKYSALWNNNKTSEKKKNSGYKTIKINMEGKTHTLYINGVAQYKSPSGKLTPSLNPSDNKAAPSTCPSEKFTPYKSSSGKLPPSLKPTDTQKKMKGYNVVKINIGGKTSLVQDDSKELDIMILMKSEKKHGIKFRNTHKINYDKLVHPKVN